VSVADLPTSEDKRTTGRNDGWYIRPIESSVLPSQSLITGNASSLCYRFSHQSRPLP